MRRPHLCMSLFACGVLLMADGCRRRDTPLATKTSVEARRAALASALIPNLDRTFDRVAAIAKELSLPFDRDVQKRSVLDATKVPQAILSALRTDAPMAVVAFAPNQKSNEPELVMAIAGRSPRALAAAIAGLGKPIASQGAARQFQAGEDSRWFLQRAGALVVATSFESLIQGADLAIELAVPSQDDAAVWMSPLAIAKSQGTDLKTALSGLLATTFGPFNPTPSQSATVSALLRSLLESIVDRAAEVEEGTLSLRLDADKGMALRISAIPHKGSTLASMVRQTKPFSLDGRVVPENNPVVLAAFSATDLVKTVWNKARPIVAIDKRGEEAAKHIDVLTEALASGGSSAVSVVDDRLHMAGAYGVRPSANGAAVLSALEGLMSGSWYTGLLATVDAKSKVHVRRDRGALVVSTSAEQTRKLPAAMARSLKGMGLTSQSYAMVVKEDTLFYASGDRPVDSVHRLASAPPRKPAGPCAAAVAESEGADAFFFMDFAPFFKMGAAESEGTADPGASTLSLPFWLSYRGGESATVELRIPVELAKGMAPFIPMLIGLGQPSQ